MRPAGSLLPVEASGTLEERKSLAKDLPVLRALVLLAVLSLSASALARARLCPTGSEVLVSCTATATLPLVPFVAVCAIDEDAFIVLDPGAGRRPMSYRAAARATETVTTWYATAGAAADNLKLEIDHEARGRGNAVLSFDSVFGGVSKFICR